MLRAHVLIIRRSKLHYAASGSITPIGGSGTEQLICTSTGNSTSTNGEEIDVLFQRLILLPK